MPCSGDRSRTQTKSKRNSLKLTQCCHEAKFLYKKSVKGKKGIIDRSLLTRKQHTDLLAQPHIHEIPEPPRKRNVRQCKIPDICPPRVDQLAIPTQKLLKGVLHDYNCVLEAERVVRLVQLVNSNREDSPGYISEKCRKIELMRKKKQKKKEKKKERKNKKENCMKVWLKARVKKTTKLIMRLLLDRREVMPNYKQLMVSIELFRLLKVKRKRSMCKYTKTILMKICEQIAIYCDTECPPYKKPPAMEPLPPTEAGSVESGKHIYWQMREPVEEGTEEGEEEEEAESEKEGEEEAEGAVGAAGEGVISSEAEGAEESDLNVCEVEEEMSSDESGGFPPTIDETGEESHIGEAESEFLPIGEEGDEQGEGEEGGAGGGEEGGAGGGEEGGTGGGEEGGAGGGEEGSIAGGEEGATTDGEEGAITGGEEGVTTGGEEGAITEGEEGATTEGGTTEGEGGIIEGEGHTTESGITEGEGGGSSVFPEGSTEEGITTEGGEGETDIEVGEDIGIHTELGEGESSYVEIEGEISGEGELVLPEEEGEEEVVPPTKPEGVPTGEAEKLPEGLVDVHPPDTVSYLTCQVYSSWMEEFGANLLIYSKCLRKFREMREARGVKPGYEKIIQVLNNWGTYLQDSREFEQNMAVYLKGKPVTKCPKCGDFTLYNIPDDHEIPPELKVAVDSTVRWHGLLEDAEKMCKEFGKEEEDTVSLASHETVHIVDALPQTSDTSMYVFEDFVPNDKCNNKNK